MTHGSPKPKKTFAARGIRFWGRRVRCTRSAAAARAHTKALFRSQISL
jgi:hypothetical protein